MQGNQVQEHFNSVDAHVQFTTEKTRPDGSIPFLDDLFTPEQYRTLSTTVYRKQTKRDEYLHWDSQHKIVARYSVFNTLTHS